MALSTPELVKVRILKPYMDKKEGDVIELAPVAADRFVNTGYAKRIKEPPSNKAISEPPNDKSVPGRKKATQRRGRPETPK